LSDEALTQVVPLPGPGPFVCTGGVGCVAATLGAGAGLRGEGAGCVTGVFFAANAGGFFTANASGFAGGLRAGALLAAGFLAAAAGFLAAGFLAAAAGFLAAGFLAAAAFALLLRAGAFASFAVVRLVLPTVALPRLVFALAAPARAAPFFAVDFAPAFARAVAVLRVLLVLLVFAVAFLADLAFIAMLVLRSFS
jgi:hypothetical protein